MAAVYNIIEGLDVRELRAICKRQVDAGVLDPLSLQPLFSLERSVLDSKHGTWYRHKISRHIFDLPEDITNPIFLAEGGYGCVARASYRGQQVAVKKVPIPAKADEDEAARLLREIVVLKKAREEDQRSVCEILEIYGTHGATKPNELKHFYMVMPLYSPGCLENFVVETPELFKTICVQTLQALHWLHAHGVLHRDIKRENIFYDAKTNRAVLGDLGSTRRNQKTKMTGKNMVGTKCYLAPEFCLDKPYGYASDVWSLGVTWWEMLCLKDDDATLFPQSTAGGKDHLAKQKELCSKNSSDPWAAKKWLKVKNKEEQWNEPSYTRLFRSIFVFDASKRATLDDLFDDPFFMGEKTKFEITQMPALDISKHRDIRTYLFHAQTIGNSKAATTVATTAASNSDVMSVSDISSVVNMAAVDAVSRDSFRLPAKRLREKTAMTDAVASIKRRRTSAIKQRSYD
eukprot:GEMP01028333.1.p1 GENE.GEMP01028333.1~~GEMP01028333.1.p1  ORF type:complete len:459 (+),score=75.66 GEMP01028333.1:31-1407(+)